MWFFQDKFGGPPVRLSTVPQPDGSVAIGVAATVNVAMAPSGPTNQFGYQQITDLSEAVSLTVPQGATQATIIIEGADCRARYDGVPPTATVGMPLATGMILTLNGAEVPSIMLIQQADGAIANIQYEG